MSASISASALAAAASAVETFGAGWLVVEAFVGKSAAVVSSSFVDVASVEVRGAGGAVDGLVSGRVSRR